MAITFPRDLPNYHVQQCIIDLVDNVVVSPSGKGSVMNASQVNDPSWTISVVTGLLDVAKQAVWSAWRKSMRGGIKTFIAYDVRRTAPLAYPMAKLPSDIKTGWNGQCAVTSLGLSGALGLDGLPENYQFKAGDRVSLVEGGHYGYHEVLEDVTADGIGAVTVTVTPFLYTTLFTTAAVAQIWQAKCQFMIDNTSWNESGEVEPAPVNFKGFQRL